MKIAELELLAILSGLPGDVAVTTEEAAVLLRVSPSTLAKMRMPNHPVKGPPYIQAGDKGTTGANQKVTYLIDDLKAWQRANRVTDTQAAAVRKGQLFCTITDLAEERPYWTNESGLISGPVMNTSEDVFVARILSPVWSVDWLNATDVSLRPWAGIIGKRAHVAEVERVLMDVLGGVRGALERDEFEAEACTGKESYEDTKI